MRVLFRLFALLSVAAAIYHGVGLFHPVNTSPPWRHALFVAIDLFCAYGFLRRPPWFLWAFAVLAAQQCYGHGGTFMLKLEEHHISWMDLGVVLFMVLALACLIIARRQAE